MRRVLITGMSGTGKSSVIQALAARELKAIDTDWNPKWEQVNGDEWIWREDQIRRLLDKEDADVLFVRHASQTKAGSTTVSITSSC